MSVEIERKFLVNMIPSLRDYVSARLVQAYVARHGDTVLRVRTEAKSNGAKSGYVTVKGKGTLTKPEYEMSVPYKLADDIIQGQLRDPQARAPLAKTRFFINSAPGTCNETGLMMELDVFQGEGLWNLALLEVELPSPDHPLVLPAWVGREVTEDRAYSNVGLLYDGVPDSYVPPSNIQDFYDRYIQ